MSADDNIARVEVLRRKALRERYAKDIVAHRYLLSAVQKTDLDTCVEVALSACETQTLPCVDITKWTVPIEAVVLVLREAGISVGWHCNCAPSSVMCACTHKNATQIQMCVDTSPGRAYAREFP